MRRLRLFVSAASIVRVFTVGSLVALNVSSAHPAGVPPTSTMEQTAASSTHWPATERQVKLILPADLLALPKLPSERFLVYAPQIDQAGRRQAAAWAANTYQHNPIITWWKGRFYCAWSTAPQNEQTPPMGGLLSTSGDGADWTPPVQTPGWENLVPRGWHQTKDRLYLWSTSSPPHVLSTEDGQTWEPVSPEEIRDLSGVPSNKKFLTLRDGRVMAFSMKNGSAFFPITSDPTGLTGWKGDTVDSRDCPNVGEPGGWEDRKGGLHGVIRSGDRIWHTYSADHGRTWTRLVQQPGFSDSPGNKEFGAFPDGEVWYVGNPKPGSRMELVLGISRDGWTFDRNYLVRWETIQPIWYSKFKSESRPGYEYPGAVYHNGCLYIAYARTRDMIEVCKVPVSQLLRR